MLCLGNVTISFNTAAVAAAIPTIAADFGLSDLTVSKIIPFYMIPYGLGALSYAPLTRRYTYRAILIAAMGLYLVSSLLSGLTGNLNILMGAQIFSGIAAACSTPLSLMIIGDLFEKDIRGRLVGIFFGTSFGASIAGMFVLGIAPWKWLFFIPFVVGLISVICLVANPLRLIQIKHTQSVNYFKAFLTPRIRDVFIFIFCSSFIYHGVHKWYGIFLNREYGLDKASISAILIIVAICGLSGQQIGGFLSDKRGRRAACLAGLSILSLAIMLLLGNSSLYILVIILGLISIGWTISHNSISTLLTDFPEKERPMIASLNSAVRFISGGLGFFVSKMLVAKSFHQTFFLFGLAMLLLIFYVRKIMDKHEMTEAV